MSVPVRLLGSSREVEPAVESHPRSMELVLYARGALARSRAAAIRAHCEGCAACGGQLGALLLLRMARLNGDCTTPQEGG